MKTISSLFAAAVLAAALSPAHAQDGEAGVTLQVNRGSVMVSEQGGEFASVSGSAVLQADSRIMLAEDSAGTLVYANGCRLRLEDPGVHDVPTQAACSAVAAADGGVGTGTGTVAVEGGTALLLGGTVAVAAILANMDGDDPAPPPVSP